MGKFWLVFAATLLVGTDLLAQSAQTANTLRLDDDDARPAAMIEDVAWLAGQWRGEGLGGVLEEIWAPPLGSTMTGAFKVVRADTIWLYELMAIVPQENSLALWVKHFNPDFSGWEEKDGKVVFRLVSLAPDAAQFEGLTFRRAGPDALDVYLAIGMGEGEMREEKLTYRRHVGAGAEVR